MAKETFEDALGQLEQIVKQLEDQSVGLEEALKLFDRGMRLAKRCQTQLDSVQRRVDQLIAEAAEGEEGATAPFSPEEG